MWTWRNYSCGAVHTKVVSFRLAVGAHHRLWLSHTFFLLTFGNQVIPQLCLIVPLECEEEHGKNCRGSRSALIQSVTYSKHKHFDATCMNMPMWALPALSPFICEENRGDDNFEKWLQLLNKRGRLLGLSGSVTMSVAGTPNDGTADLPHSEAGSESLPLLHWRNVSY